MSPYVKNPCYHTSRLLICLLLAPLSALAQDYSTRAQALDAARHGDRRAMRRLAEMERDGEDGPQDLKKAAEIYRQLANARDNDAAMELGYFYANGWGVEKDVKQAEKWFEVGAATGMQFVDVANLYAEGVLLPRNDEKAVELYRRAGSVGVAEIGLGKMYLAGRGVPQSDEKAAEQFHNAAVGNTPAGQLLYADMLMAGKGVPQDTAAAMDWYTRAAQRRLADAAWDVMVDYSGTRGGDHNLELEHRWRHYAAALNYDLAEVNLGNRFLSGDDEARNFVEGFAWLTIGKAQLDSAKHELEQFAKEAPLPEDFMRKVEARVAELQTVKAASGAYYEDASYASPAPQIEELRRRADAAIPLAQIRLAYAYQMGQGVPQDMNLAIRLYKLVGEDGPSELHVQLGVSYAEGDGDGVPRNYEAARDWLLRATEEGSARGARFLGEMDRDGRGANPSAMYATMWLTLGASDPLAAKELQDVQSKLTAEEKQKAEELVTAWHIKHHFDLH